MKNKPTYETEGIMSNGTKQFRNNTQWLFMYIKNSGEMLRDTNVHKIDFTHSEITLLDC